MKKQVFSYLMCILIGIILVACGQSRGDIDARSTQIVDSIFETLTAEGATSTATATGTAIPTATHPTPPTVTPTPLGGGHGRIAFMSNRDGSIEIYVMNADGSGKTQLTKNQSPIENGYLAWSPDGERIAFVSDRDGRREIYIMNSDGSDQTRLTHKNEPGNVNPPRIPIWSPDGKRLAFVSTSNPRNYKIYVMNADGTGLTYLADTTAAGLNPIWSPDGKQLAFISGGDLYVMNADGTGLVNLTKDRPGTFRDPAWSPDGKQLAFISGGDLYVMNADGTKGTQLTHEMNVWPRPVWSPDGERIAFMDNREFQNWVLYTINADGSSLTFFANAGQLRDAGYGHPDWSPDGSWISFVIEHDRNYDIYVISVDDTGIVRMTESSGWDAYATWQP